MAITIDGSSGIASVDGSAASPSVRGTDANSGILYTADAIKFSTGGTQRAVIDNNGLSSAGHILQVKQTLWNTHDGNLSNTSFAALSGFTVDITPSATSSKMLITLNLLLECRSTSVIAVQLTRGGAEMFVNEGGYRGESAFGGYVSMTYLDSPNTTSQVTYGVETRTSNSNYVINNYIGSGPSNSFLTVMEVGG